MSDEAGFGIPLLNDWVRQHGPDGRLVQILEAASHRPFNGAFTTTSLLYGIATTTPELLGGVANVLPVANRAPEHPASQANFASHNTIDVLNKTAEVAARFGRAAPTAADLLATLIAPPPPHGEETSARKYLRSVGLLSPATDALLAWVARHEQDHSNAMRGFLAVGVLPPRPAAAPTASPPPAPAPPEHHPGPEETPQETPQETPASAERTPVPDQRPSERAISHRPQQESRDEHDQINFDLLDDRPSDEDHLDFAPYADALAQLIQRPNTKTPFTIAISAPWGAGKSTLGKMIVKRLTSDRRAASRPAYAVCWFNAWMHDEAPSLATAFAAEVMRAVNESRPWWLRLLRPLPAALWRPSHRKSFTWVIAGAAVCGALALVAGLLSGALDPHLTWLQSFFQIPQKQSGEWIQSVRSTRSQSVGLGALTFAASLATAALKRALTVARTVEQYVLDPKKTAGQGDMEEVRGQIGEIVEQATREGLWLRTRARYDEKLAEALELRKKRVVVFVDDIERCKPPRSLEVLEVMNQLLCHPQVVCVALADVPSVEAAAGLKYKDLAEVLPSDDPSAASRKIQAFGRQYLQKIVQLQFSIPPSQPEQIKTMISAATAETKVDTAAQAGKAAREHYESFARGKQLVIAGASFLVLVLFIVWWVWKIEPAGIVAAILFLVVGLVGALSNKGQADDALINALAYSFAAKSARQGDSLDEVARAAGRAAKNQKNASEVGLEAAKAAIFEKTDVLEDAVREAYLHLPGLPRNAKRMVNSLRLTVYIASVRKLFQTTKLTPFHVGKSSVLRERWPDLSLRLISDARLTIQLEQASQRSPDDFLDTLQNEGIEVSNPEELQELLSTAPSLGPVMPLLFYLEPVSDPAA